MVVPEVVSLLVTDDYNEPPSPTGSKLPVIFALFAVGIIGVGIVLAANVGGVADRAARWNARSGGLPVNSKAWSWRLTGVMALATGIPLTIWAITHP